jgi:glutamate/aspartate transport system substrate-binding protein
MRGTAALPAWARIMTTKTIAATALMSAVMVATAACFGTSAAIANEALEGRLKTIKESATLRIAYRTDSRPFSYADQQGKPAGYTIDLCERVAKSLEQQLGTALKITYVQVDTRTRFDRIVDGSADMECGSTTMSLSRMKIADFSSVIFAESTGIMVKSGRRIFSFDDMAGKTVGVIADSTNGKAVRDQLARRRLDAKLVEFRDREEGIAALVRGDLDGFATDKLVLFALAQAANLSEFVVLPEDLSFEPFAIMLPRGDWAFRLAVNTALAQVFRSGEIIELYTKHFSGLGRGASNWVGAVFVFGGLPE